MYYFVRKQYRNFYPFIVALMLRNIHKTSFWYVHCSSTIFIYFSTCKTKIRNKTKTKLVMLLRNQKTFLWNLRHAVLLQWRFLSYILYIKKKGLYSQKTSPCQFHTGFFCCFFKQYHISPCVGCYYRNRCIR